jgi:hypothetical protein
VQRRGGDLAASADVDGFDFVCGEEFIELGSADSEECGGFGERV